MSLAPAPMLFPAAHVPQLLYTHHRVTLSMLQVLLLCAGALGAAFCVARVLR